MSPQGTGQATLRHTRALPTQMVVAPARHQLQSCNGQRCIRQGRDAIENTHPSRISLESGSQQILGHGAYDNANEPTTPTCWQPEQPIPPHTPGEKRPLNGSESQRDAKEKPGVGDFPSKRGQPLDAQDSHHMRCDPSSWIHGWYFGLVWLLPHEAAAASGAASRLLNESDQRPGAKALSGPQGLIASPLRRLVRHRLPLAARTGPSTAEPSLAPTSLAQGLGGS